MRAKIAPLLARTIAVTAMAYLALRTGYLIYAMNADNHMPTAKVWLVASMATAVIAVGFASTLVVSSQVIKLVRSARFKLAAGMGIVIAVSAVNQQLAPVVFRVLTQYVWVEQPRNLLDHQVDGASAISLIIAIAVVTLALGLSLEALRLARWWMLRTKQLHS